MSGPGTTPGLGTSAAEVLGRCADLDRFSASPDHLERTHLTPEHARANALVATWMAEAGLRTWSAAARRWW